MSTFYTASKSERTFPALPASSTRGLRYSNEFGKGNIIDVKKKVGATETIDIEQGLASIIMKRVNEKLKCDHCEEPNPDHEGFGQFLCAKCGKISFSNYGKARAAIEKYGSMNTIDLAQRTGLTKKDIHDLTSVGYMSISGNVVSINR